MKEVTLQIPDGKKIEWREVNGVTVPTLVDEEVRDDRPVTERVKTLEDAIREIGENHRLVKEWRMVEHNTTIFSRDILALMKLRIITLALNEGWEPTFNGTDECRYYAWFEIVTASKLSKMTNEERKEQHILPLVGADAVDGSQAGLGSVLSITRGRIRTRASGLALLIKQANLPNTLPNSSRNFGVTGASGRDLARLMFLRMGNNMFISGRARFRCSAR